MLHRATRFPNFEENWRTWPITQVPIRDYPESYIFPRLSGDQNPYSAELQDEAYQAERNHNNIMARLPWRCVLPPGERYSSQDLDSLAYALRPPRSATPRPGPEARMNQPDIFYPRIPQLPSWDPAGSKSFQEWLMDIRTWMNQSASRMNAGDQATIIRQALRGAAAEFVRTFPEANGNHGGTVNGIQVDPVTYLLYALSIVYSTEEPTTVQVDHPEHYPPEDAATTLATTYMLESMEEPPPTEHQDETIEDVKQYPPPREIESTSHSEPPIHKEDGSLNPEYIFPAQLSSLELRKADDGQYYNELQFRTYYGAETYALKWAEAAHREKFESPEDYGLPQTLTERNILGQVQEFRETRTL